MGMMMRSKQIFPEVAVIQQERDLQAVLMLKVCNFSLMISYSVEC